jgi:hypothetical protein
MSNLDPASYLYGKRPTRFPSLSVSTGASFLPFWATVGALLGPATLRGGSDEPCDPQAVVTGVIFGAVLLRAVRASDSTLVMIGEVLEGPWGLEDSVTLVSVALADPGRGLDGSVTLSSSSSGI